MSDEIVKEVSTISLKLQFPCIDNTLAFTPGYFGPTELQSVAVRMPFEVKDGTSGFPVGLWPLFLLYLLRALCTISPESRLLCTETGSCRQFKLSSCGFHVGSMLLAPLSKSKQ